MAEAKGAIKEKEESPMQTLEELEKQINRLELIISQSPYEDVRLEAEVQLCQARAEYELLDAGGGEDGQETLFTL